LPKIVGKTFVSSCNIERYNQQIEISFNLLIFLFN
jgi:hypothetical protein